MALSNLNGTWTLSHEEYMALIRDSRHLEQLHANGVDNWEGYRRLREDDDEDYDW